MLSQAAPAAADPAVQALRPAQQAGQREQARPVKDQGPLPVSLDRIRRELDQPPVSQSGTTLNLDRVALPEADPSTEEGKQGTSFKVRVEASRFELPPFMETLKQPWQPVVAGGLYHHEVMQLITPEGVRGSAPFTNGEMLQVAVTSLATALAMRGGIWAARNAIDWLRLQREEAARREVQDELAEFKRQVAEGAAGSTGTSPPIIIKKDP